MKSDYLINNPIKNIFSFKIHIIYNEFAISKEGRNYNLIEFISQTKPVLIIL